MSEQPPEDPFKGYELGPDAILGTRTFEDILFTDETETPVNVLTGETPEHSQANIDEARAFADGIDSDTPQIALQASVEAQIETASKPYTAAVFFHFKATGSLKRHRAYHAAYESEAFAVEFEADYESGDLTITVERVTESDREESMCLFGKDTLQLRIRQSLKFSCSITSSSMCCPSTVYNETVSGHEISPF